MVIPHLLLLLLYCRVDLYCAKSADISPDADIVVLSSSVLFLFLVVVVVVVVYFSTCGFIVAGLVLGFSKHALTSMFWLLALVIAQSGCRPSKDEHIVSHFDKVAVDIGRLAVFCHRGGELCQACYVWSINLLLYSSEGGSRLGGAFNIFFIFVCVCVSRLHIRWKIYP